MAWTSALREGQGGGFCAVCAETGGLTATQPFAPRRGAARCRAGGASGKAQSLPACAWPSVAERAIGAAAGGALVCSGAVAGRAADSGAPVPGVLRGVLMRPSLFDSFEPRRASPALLLLLLLRLPLIGASARGVGVGVCADGALAFTFDENRRRGVGCGRGEGCDSGADGGAAPRRAGAATLELPTLLLLRRWLRTDGSGSALPSCTDGSGGILRLSFAHGMRLLRCGADASGSVSGAAGALCCRTAAGCGGNGVAPERVLLCRFFPLELLAESRSRVTFPMPALSALLGAPAPATARAAASRVKRSVLSWPFAPIAVSGADAALRGRHSASPLLLRSCCA